MRLSAATSSRLTGRLLCTDAIEGSKEGTKLYIQSSLNHYYFYKKAKPLRIYPHSKYVFVWDWDLNLNLGCKELGIWPLSVCSTWPYFQRFQILIIFKLSKLSETSLFFTCLKEAGLSTFFEIFSILGIYNFGKALVRIKFLLLLIIISYLMGAKEFRARAL